VGILVLVRHGKSEWNKRNIFTGWVDIPLSPEGIDEALECGREIAHIPFDVIFTSTLNRAMSTAMLAMSVHDEGKVPCFMSDDKRGQVADKKTLETLIPVYSAWELNERMYGELQGRDKDACRKEFGEEQVKIWRRSFATPPPGGESLKETTERTLPYFEEKIVPYLKKGKNVLISAHGNSLRAIVKRLDGLSDDEILHLEIPTGRPIAYRMEGEELKKIPPDAAL